MNGKREGKTQQSTVKLRKKAGGEKLNEEQREIQENKVNKSIRYMMQCSLVKRY